MNPTKPRISVTCPDCDRPMIYQAETPNIKAFWVCGGTFGCGHSEAAVDPRHAPPVANKRAFADDEREHGPI